MVQGVTEEPPEPEYEEKPLWTADIKKPKSFRGNILMVNRASYIRKCRKQKLTIFWASLCEVNNAIEGKDFKQ